MPQTPLYPPSHPGLFDFPIRIDMLSRPLYPPSHPGLFDTHAHYDDNRYNSDADSVIRAAFSAGVGYILNAGCDVASSLASVDFAERFGNIYASAGVHPHSAKSMTDDTIDILRAIARHPKVVAIGECGLDYYRGLSPRDVQRIGFEAQLELAVELDMPVIVHCRDAIGDTLDTVRRYDLRGVFHSFSGSIEVARELVERGWYLSFAGPLTYKNATNLRDVFRTVPRERLLIETDCPYLTPEPKRGQRNDSSLLVHIAKVGAELLGMNLDDFVELTTENAKRLFNINC